MSGPLATRVQVIRLSFSASDEESTSGIIRLCWRCGTCSGSMSPFGSSARRGEARNRQSRGAASSRTARREGTGLAAGLSREVFLSDSRQHNHEERYESQPRTLDMPLGGADALRGAAVVAVRKRVLLDLLVRRQAAPPPNREHLLFLSAMDRARRGHRCGLAKRHRTRLIPGTKVAPQVSRP